MMGCATSFHENCPGSRDGGGRSLMRIVPHVQGSTDLSNSGQSSRAWSIIYEGRRDGTSGQVGSGARGR